MIRRSPAFAALLAALALAASTARAESITFTQTVVGSGSFGSTPGPTSFTDALVTFTQTADTTTVRPGLESTLLVTAITSTVTVQGRGTGSFTSPTSVLSQPVTGSLGLVFGAGTFGQPLVIQGFPGGLGFRLTTALGPITGSGQIAISLGTGFDTSFGSFNLRSVSSNVTFTATLGVVPEPSTIALVASALPAGLVLWRRNRKRAAAPQA